MITGLLFLYMTYSYNMPAWTMVSSWIVFVIGLYDFLKGIYDAGKNSDNK